MCTISMKMTVDDCTSNPSTCNPCARFWGSLFKTYMKYVETFFVNVEAHSQQVQANDINAVDQSPQSINISSVIPDIDSSKNLLAEAKKQMEFNMAQIRASASAKVAPVKAAQEAAAEKAAAASAAAKKAQEVAAAKAAAAAKAEAEAAAAKAASDKAAAASKAEAAKDAAAAAAKDADAKTAAAKAAAAHNEYGHYQPLYYPYMDVQSYENVGFGPYVEAKEPNGTIVEVRMPVQRPYFYVPQNGSERVEFQANDAASKEVPQANGYVYYVFEPKPAAGQ